VRRVFSSVVQSLVMGKLFLDNSYLNRLMNSYLNQLMKLWEKNRSIASYNKMAGKEHVWGRIKITKMWTRCARFFSESESEDLDKMCDKK
jgi:hypothetical protein